MARVWSVGLAAIVASGLLAGCASVLGRTESEVSIRTSPASSRCEIKGRDDFAMVVQTPATVKLPTAAAPLTVTCGAPGHRPTVYTLNTSSDGWMWGNGALMAVTGGVAIIGAIVDGSRDAGMAYAKDVSFDLDRDVPRAIRVRDRSRGAEMDLQAR